MTCKANEDQLKQEYGFVANPKLTVRQNITRIKQSHNASELFGSIPKLAFHDLTENGAPHRFTRLLLGLDLKFCLAQRLPSPYPTPGSIERVKRNIRNQAYLPKRGPMPDLFCSDPKWAPPKSDARTEDALNEFESKIKCLCRDHHAQPYRNLTILQRTILKQLREDKSYVILMCDKNLGPAIIERDRYIELVVRDHLSDYDTYLRLSEEGFTAARKEQKAKIQHFIERLGTRDRDEATKAEVKFLQRRLDKDTRIPDLYALAKVHKGPIVSSRPIISTVGSPLSGLAKWVDSKLQPAFKGLPSYLRDTRDLLGQLKQLGRLPKNARLFTADAVGMYTNIDIAQGIEAIRYYLLNRYCLYTKVEVAEICNALEIVMTNNIFKFGDTYWRQLIGVAMGIEPAPPFASIYYGNHECNQILPNFQHCLLLYKRYIDDIIGCWIGDEDEWKDFKNSLNVDILEWKCSDLSHQVIFLDLTISIESSGDIVTRLYEKPMNLHLYIPNKSAHPSSVLKGLIIGQVQRFRICNTHFNDFKSCVFDFFGHLRARGYDKEQLKPLFIDALERVNLHSSQLPMKPKRADQAATVLVVDYHPRNVSTKRLHQVYKSTIARLHGYQPCHPPDAQGTIRSERLIIAHKRSRNLRDVLTSSTLHSYPDQVEVSTILQHQPLPEL